MLSVRTIWIVLRIWKTPTELTDVCWYSNGFLCYISADQSDHNPAFPWCSCRLLQWSAYSVLCLMICSSLREQCIDGPACALWKAFSVSGRIKHITLNKYEIELQAMCSEAKQNSSQQPTMSMTQSYITGSTLLFPFVKYSFKVLKSERLLLKGIQSHWWKI